ncbi:MAG: secretin N-terminal domain-containing protein [Planctomycetota bacterium]
MESNRKLSLIIFRCLSIILCIIIFSSIVLLAQEKQTPTAISSSSPTPSVTDKPSIPTITVEWVDKPLRAALETIGEIANVNIIIDLRISNEDTITVTFRNLDWHSALEETVMIAQCILEEATPSLFRITKPPTINMDLKNAPLEEVIRNIAKLAGINVIISEDIKGAVTMILSDVPWLEALNNIVKTTGFSLVREKYNVIRIVKTETLKDQLETRIFRLKYLRPPASFKATIVTPYAVGKVKPTEDAIKEFTLLNILKNMLSHKGNTPIGSLEYDTKTNSIIVQDIKTVLDSIEKILDQLDVAPRQVLIELKFVSTTNDDLINLGLKYEFGGTVNPKSDIIKAKPSPASISTTLPFGFGRKQDTSFNQFFLNSYDASTILRLFKSDTKTKFIQEPNLLTIDGEEATVFVGELIRYPQIKVTYSSAGIPMYELTEATPINVGFQLWVTPHIVQDTNKIIITLIPRLEDLSGQDNGFETYEIAGQTLRLPRVRQSTIVTNLIIESGQTAIVGGLVDERLTKILERIPFLGDIPFVNNLFRYKSGTLIERKLLVFVTPRIITSAESTVKILENKIKGTEGSTEIDTSKKWKWVK